MRNADTKDTMVNSQKRSLPSWSLPFIGRGLHQTSQRMDEQEHNCIMKEKDRAMG